MSKPAELPAFVLIKLPLKDGYAERAALRNAGLPVFIKGESLGADRDNVYAVDALELYDPVRREDILDMLATLGVPHILHVSGDRTVTRCDKGNNYLPISAPRIGEWRDSGSVTYVGGYRIKGRQFHVAPK